MPTRGPASPDAETRTAPAGIGTPRAASGSRDWHPEPALRAMPGSKLGALGDLMSEWIAEGGHACGRGWPNMWVTVTGGTWMAFAPGGTEIFTRGLDFRRMEGGLIRENGVPRGPARRPRAARRRRAGANARVRKGPRAGRDPASRSAPPVTRPRAPSPRRDGRRARIADGIGPGRVGKVEEITGLAVSCASDAAALAFGTSRPVDGGWTAD